MSRTPTPDQKRAIATIHSSLPVTAGAGSGKTFVLTHRYFQILAEQAADLDEILAITFTEKAANQMKEKIRHLLTDFAAGRQSEGFPPVMKDNLTLPDREYWHRLLDTFERSYISTIHGFCARILRESAVETGLDPEFTVMDEHTTALQLPGIIRREIFELIRNEDENIALWLQYYSLGEILHRYQGMVRGRIEYDGLREHYLGEKSGDDLLNELREQLEEAIPEEIDSLRDHPVWQQIADSLEKMSPQKETDHFFPHYQNLRDIQARLGRTSNRLELGNLWKAAAENLKSKGAKGNWLGVDLTELKNVMKDFRTDVLEPLLEEVYEFHEADEREAIRLARSGARIFSKVLSGYREWKSERNYLDYNDLLRMAVDLLGQHPHLRKKYANQFKFILLDEFQDTNPIQYRLVELLSDNGSGEGSIFVVGDPKQSIYRFRGTEVELFQDARNNLPDPGITLNISFRSRPSLLAWYNACFSRVMGTADDQRERARYEQHYIPLEPHREEPDQPAYGVSISFVETEHSSRAFSIDEKIQVEAAHIADWIRNHLGDIKVDRGDGSERARPGDVAILFRKTTHLKRYEHALRIAGIPFFTVSGAGLFEKQEIRDIITVLEALEHPGEGIPVVGALRSHLFGMSDEGLFQLAEAGFRHQWEDVLYQDQEYFAIPESFSDDDRLVLAEAREKMQRWRGMKDRVSPGDLLDSICIESGYYGVAGLGHDGPQQLRNVEAFLRIAREFSRSRLATLGGFVEYITSLRDAAEEEEAEVYGEDYDAVKLMTVHRAKGLEFPVVIVPEMSSGGNNRMQRDFHENLGWALQWNDPTREPDEQQVKPALYQWIFEREKRRELAESRRLFYVASTRAQDHLILSGVVDGQGGVESLMKKSDLSRDDWLNWIAGVLEDMGWDSQTGMLDAEGTGVRIFRHSYGEYDSLPTTADILGEPPSAGIEQPDTAHLLPAHEIRRRWAPERKGLELQEINPSALPQFVQDPERFYRRHILNLPNDEEPGGEPGGTEYGIVAHALLERFIGSGAAKSPDTLLDSLSNAHGGISGDMRSSLLDMVKRFQDAPLYQRVTGGDAKTEVRFLTSVGGLPMSGQIDLLFEEQSGGYSIVDYKTDQVEGEEIESKVQYYRPQLLAYAYAAFRSRGSVPVSTGIYFTGPGKLVEIPWTGDIAEEFGALVNRMRDFVRERSLE